MKNVKKTIARCFLSMISATVLFGALASTGCTVHTNGMTLPSPEWTKQRVQYFPTGPQYPFSQEKAMMEAAKADTDAHLR